MTSRTILGLHGCLLLVAAAACGSGTGPPPPPPPPPPPGSPVVTAPGNSTLPVGTTFDLSATFTDTSSSGAPWSYGIDWGDGNSASGTKSAIAPITATHTFASQGDYHVTVTVTNHGGRAGSDAVTVAATAPVIIAAGDIGDCLRPNDELTANLIDDIKGIVVPLGDNAYTVGSDSEFANCYGPNWGRHKERTRPVAGNHDYYNPGAVKNADGYFGYFGSAAGDPAKGYYDYVLGSWLVIVLNTGTESASYIDAGSTQEQWLRAELASHTQQCVVAMFHHPQFSIVGGDRPFIRTETTPLWNALYEGGADLVLNGHDHDYQRYAPMKPDGTADPAHGIRQITVGTGGGEGLYTFARSSPNIEAQNDDTFGVLKVTLKDGGYDWRFVPVAGSTYTDSGSANCHGRP